MTSSSPSAPGLTATAFGEDLPGGSVHGTLAVADDGLWFSAPGVSIRLPFSDLGCRVGGLTNHTLYFTSPTQPGLEIVCTEWSISEDQRLARLPSMSAALGRARRLDRRFWSCVLLGGGFLGIGTLVLLALAALVLLWWLYG